MPKKMTTNKKFRKNNNSCKEGTETELKATEKKRPPKDKQVLLNKKIMIEIEAWYESHNCKKKQLLPFSYLETRIMQISGKVQNSEFNISKNNKHAFLVIYFLSAVQPISVQQEIKHAKVNEQKRIFLPMQ